MPTNYVIGVSQSGGGTYSIMDKDARTAIENEVTAREGAVEAEATARETAIEAEATAREAAISDVLAIALKAAGVTNYGINPTPPYDDANTFPKQSIVLAYGNKVSHLPTNTSAYSVITFNPLTHLTTVINAQIALDVNSMDLFIRTSLLNNDFQAWRKLANEDTALTSALVTGYGVDPVAPYNDANTFPKQSVVLAYGNKVSHLPDDSSAFTVATLCALNHGIIATCFQLAANVSENKIFFRASKTGDIYEPWYELSSNARIIVNPSDNLAEAIRQATRMGNATVIINGGNHNILAEYGIQDNTSTFPEDFDFRGPQLGNGVVLQGINGAKITANYGGGNDSVKDLFSCILVVGSCEISGVDFEATNVRYCIHDDYGSTNLDAGRTKITDCRMKHNGTNGNYTANCCIGGGTHRSSEHIVERCVLDSPASYPYPVSYHNNTSDSKTYGPAKVTIMNCAMMNGGTLQLYNYRPDGTNIDVLFAGNYIGDDIHYEGNPGVFNVIEFNNTKYE